MQKLINLDIHVSHFIHICSWNHINEGLYIRARLLALNK